MSADFYAALGISRQASAAEIKQAYRSAAMRYHPDKCPGDQAAQARFVEVGRAYDVLSDPARRRRYDLFGDGGGGNAAFDPRQVAEQLTHVLREVFGGLLGRADPPHPGGRAAPRQASLRVPFEVAAQGGSLPLQVERHEPCCACAGRGSRGMAPPVACPRCAGSGAWRYRQGIFSLKKTCPACGGSGREVPEPCGACAGRGVALVGRTLEVEVPPGADTGSRLELPEQGDRNPAGEAIGSLEVELQVEAPARFSRSGADLHQRLRVTPSDAALGCGLDIPSLAGQRRIKVPAGTQPHTVLRLRGHGMRRLRSPSARSAATATASDDHGDMLVEIFVETPRQLSGEQRQLYQQLQQLDGPRPQASP
jgi:molecular chaperone DnaJ